MTGAGEIGLEDVAFDDFQASLLDLVAEFLMEIVDQVRVDFDGDYFIGALQKRFGEGAFAGADFDDERHAIGASCFRDAIQNGFSKKEVLA